MAADHYNARDLHTWAAGLHSSAAKELSEDHGANHSAVKEHKKAAKEHSAAAKHHDKAGASGKVGLGMRDAQTAMPELRAAFADLDAFKRDMLLDQRGRVLPETQRRWAASQPYDVVKGLLDATPANAAAVDIANDAAPAVMIDPSTRRLFVGR